MPEECVLCGSTFAIRDGAHVTLNPPEGPIRDYYTCPQCFESHFGSTFDPE